MHVKIFNAIKRRNAAGARRATTRMMEEFRKELRQVGLLKY